MEYVATVIDRLAGGEEGGYHQGWPWASEPVAWAAMALCAHERPEAAAPFVEWLLDAQQASGSVGIDSAQPTPGWATPLAVLAWRFAERSQIRSSQCTAAIQRAVAWMLGIEGVVIKERGALGHDTTIVGWPWVEGTHAWLEPTAMCLVALEVAGYADHPRAKEAARLLEDRLLPSGGCNYGNTLVFNQELRPHLQMTGMCLLALSNRFDNTGRIGKSIDYLRHSLSSKTTTISLCFALQGLAARSAFEVSDHALLADAARKTLAADAAAYKMALLALASLGIESPLIGRSRLAAPTSAT